MGQVLHGSATTTEAIRRAIQHSKESLRALSRRYGVNQKTVRKWKARSSVVDPTDETKGTAIDGAVDRGRGGHRLLRPAYASAARGLLVRTPADNPASDALVIASLSATAWDRPSCSDRRRQAGKEKVQVLSDRLLPHRHRRSADRRGKALPLRGDRQNFEVRLRPTCRKSQSVTTSAFLVALVKAVPYKIHTVLTDRASSSVCHRDKQMGRTRDI